MMKNKRMTNEQHVTNLINWHRFLNDLIEENNKKLNNFILDDASSFKYDEMRQITLMSDKIMFYTQELYKAEHDLIDAAIIYQVPHTKMLKDGHTEDFYTLLIAKARDIDAKGVTLIRKK